MNEDKKKSVAAIICDDNQWNTWSLNIFILIYDLC